MSKLVKLGTAEEPRRRSWTAKAATLAGLVGLVGFYHCAGGGLWRPRMPNLLAGSAPVHDDGTQASLGGSEYGSFPVPGDPFHLLPCTNVTVPPALDDPDPAASWSRLFDPDPAHWNWGNATDSKASDPYAGRGIYLCGYFDVPLDYTNSSDPRIARLAVAKFQVSGLKRVHGDATGNYANDLPDAGKRSNRTIVINPGGPGGSGTSFVWRTAQEVTRRLSNGTFDVLGWDPRGVNTSQPAVSCFPYDADRDRWALLTGQYREVAATAAGAARHLQLADAMNAATFRACRERHGDLARFVSTAFVARDLEQIRVALGEDELTGYLVSYGTGIGQTYANMFPGSVGRLILDGTEYVRDHRLLGGFGWTALDNVTDAWHDGFLGECLHAGPRHCALAKSRDGRPVALEDLEARMQGMIAALVERPVVGYTNTSGPSLVTYSALVGAIYGALYNAQTWPAVAQMLYELEEGNSTLAAAFLEKQAWEYDPTLPAPPPSPKPSSDELGSLVICADAYDAPPPPSPLPPQTGHPFQTGGDVPGLDWWLSLWANMTTRSWISGNSRFFNVLPCRHFNAEWPRPPAEVYRGDLNHTLRHPVLLVAETYDPATPLRNGRRLAREMGPRNARLVAHHGYGHSSRDRSACTDAIALAYITTGELPDAPETDCYADEKPYLYGVGGGGDADAAAAGGPTRDPLEVWREHVEELALWNPGLLRGMGL